MKRLIVVTLAAICSDALSAEPQQKILGSQNGRYVFGQISDYRRDQYVLDTQTGRLWQVVSSKQDTGNEFTVLQPMFYSDSQGNLLTVPPK